MKFPISFLSSLLLCLVSVKTLAREQIKIQTVCFEKECRSKLIKNGKVHRHGDDSDNGNGPQPIPCVSSFEYRVEKKRCEDGSVAKKEMKCSTKASGYQPFCLYETSCEVLGDEKCPEDEVPKKEDDFSSPDSL